MHVQDYTLKRARESILTRSGSVQVAVLQGQRHGPDAARLFPIWIHVVRQKGPVRAWLAAD
jgi:hypothetical protein